MTKVKKKPEKFYTITPKVQPLEVYPHDLPKVMTYPVAEKAVAALGDGWRIPTREELLLIVEHKDEIPGLCLEYKAGSEGCPHWYWSSTELPGNANRAYCVRLSDGADGWYPKVNFRTSCRPVRLVPSVG